MSGKRIRNTAKKLARRDTMKQPWTTENLEAHTTDVLAFVRERATATCPDGGTCHHDCAVMQRCFRVRACGPLSGVYVDGSWPGEVVREANRREAFEQVHATMNSPRTRGGYKRPGSLNPRKQG